MIGILTNNSKSRSIINGSDRFANFNKTRDITRIGASGRYCPSYDAVIGRGPRFSDSLA